MFSNCELKFSLNWINVNQRLEINCTKKITQSWCLCKITFSNTPKTKKQSCCLAFAQENELESEDEWTDGRSFARIRSEKWK